MKNLVIKFSVVMFVILATSFKSKTSTGFVTLEVSYIQTMGGHATVLNTDTNVSYDITAVDTYGQTEVPYGNYILTSASTNACSPPLLSSVSTSTGSDTFSIDDSSTSFTIYASCY
ncbi:hypothetical protein [Pedobacter paludis]|uniref:Uncharacterized protein n=1 Tax=Pedobacter paludis TaxID=2203212 RepID=A0A317F0U8_9SPHI|nr:hypothetical protein [Pedobacter paludis]PWS32860.1 hypothetical protein DF947_07260 [Pedobacter paludis]